MSDERGGGNGASTEVPIAPRDASDGCVSGLVRYLSIPLSIDVYLSIIPLHTVQSYLKYFFSRFFLLLIFAIAMEVF